MFSKVPYTIFEGKHRPYLEVVFHNQKNSNSSSKTLAMVDSGADHTLIPFSTGLSIGLEIPSDTERLANVSGVGGGSLSYIERECNIYVSNLLNNKVYIFKETVWWVYPDNRTLQQQKNLIERYKLENELKADCKEGTKLFSHFERQMEQVIQELISLNNRLEPGVLLGRPFFDNFEFIQFCHKDREREDKCFFNYKVKKGKPLEIIQSSSLDTIEGKG